MNRRPDKTPSVRLTGPADVIEAVPYLVGFTPRDSVVVIAMSGGSHRVVVVARVGLADDPLHALEPFWSGARRNGADTVIVTVHDESAAGPPLPWRGLVDELTAAARAAGTPVLDALCVGASRWWSYGCDDPSCCPPEGRPFGGSWRAPAEFVLRGAAPVESRRALRDELLADTDRSLAVADCLASAVPTGSPPSQAAAVASIDAMVGRASWESLDAHTAAHVLVWLQDRWVRDTQFLARTGAENRRAADVWLDLVRVAPNGYRAAPAVLLAAARFAEGDGARANVALELADEDEPGYPMAQLVGRAIAGVLTPSEVARTLDRAARQTRARLDRGAAERAR